MLKLTLVAVLTVSLCVGCGEQPVVSNAPTAEPTPTETVIPTVEPTPTEAVAPTSTPTPTPTVTVAPTSTPTPTPTSILGYRITDNKVEITSLIDKSLTEIEIPNEIEGYPVTSIGDDAFEECYRLTSIITPAGSYAEKWATTNGYSFILEIK